MASHTPNVGPGWVNAGPTTTAKLLLDGVGGAYLSGTGGAGEALYRQATPMPQADYSVFAVLRKYSAPTVSPGLVSRTQDPSNYYLAWWNEGAARWEFYRRQGGVNIIQGFQAATFPTGTAVTAELRATGNTHTLWVNGALILTVVDVTFPAAGYAGLTVYSPEVDTPTTGIHAEQWQTWLP